MTPGEGGTAAQQRPVTPGSPELRTLVEAVAEGASERDDTLEPPYAAMSMIREAKLGAIRVPVEDGGGGSTLRQLFELAIDLGRADPNIAQILRNHFAFVEFQLADHGGRGQGRWLSDVVGGKLFGMIGTELAATTLGSRDQFGTTLTRTDNGLRLTGVKYYSTGAMFSDWICVTAVYDGEVVTAVVPADSEGVIFEEDWDGIGQRLTASGTTRLVDVHVEPDDILRHSFSQSTFFQLYLTAVIAGIMEAVVAEGVALLERRGERTYAHASAPRPVDDPLLQEALGQIASAAYASRTTVLASAELLDQLAESTTAGAVDERLALDAAVAAAKSKVVVDEFAARAGSLLFDVGGASATRRVHNLDRHWRNMRTLASHNPAMYKARAVGEHAITGGPLPASGFF